MGEEKLFKSAFAFFNRYFGISWK